MSRKPLLEGQRAQKARTIDKLTEELENPRTLDHFLPPDMLAAVENIPLALTNVDEAELLKILLEEYKYQPTNTVLTLRRRFWQEFDIAFATNQQMNMVNIYSGVCSRAYMHKIMKEQLHVLAFILNQPIEYIQALEALEPLQLQFWNEMMNLPVRENGKLQDPKVLELKHKVALAIDLRTKGGYLNRSETKNLTMLHQKSEHTHSHRMVLPGTENLTAAQIESKIEEELKMLEEESRKALPPPTPKFESPLVVEVEYKDVEERGD